MAFDPTIPVLHLPDYYEAEKKQAFLDKLEDAMHNVGFFALTGTGVEKDVLDLGYEQMKHFFSGELEEKMLLYSIDGQRGYCPTESAKDEVRKDCKEFYHIGRENEAEDFENLGYGKNIWPTSPPLFKKSMISLYNSLDKCKADIGLAIAEVLGMPSDYLNKMTKNGDVLMRAIHYPASPPKEAIWAGAHTDINLFTLLPRSTAKGLQVQRRDGQWIDVIVPDNAFVINCGDMLENLTNGYCLSARHRVIDPGLGQERYSLVMFVHPRSKDRLDPLPAFIEKTGGIRKYANVNRLELLAERLIDLGVASKDLMQYFVDSAAIDRLKEVNRFSPKAEKALIEEGFSF